MTVSETDLKNQLADLDWGTGAPASTPPPAVVQPDSATDVADGPLDTLDVAVAGVKPARARRARAARVVRQPNAQALLDAARSGDTVQARAPGSRRPRTAAPLVLVQAGEGPAVIALFDAMWKDVGAKLARGVGRAKASRQDAAIGWYALLLAMRERDASK